MCTFYRIFFAKVYVAEIKNLDRILESLVRSGMIPSGFSVPSTAVSGSPILRRS